jgi:hypothetical protein
MGHCSTARVCDLAHDGAGGLALSSQVRGAHAEGQRQVEDARETRGRN